MRIGLMRGQESEHVYVDRGYKWQIGDEMNAILCAAGHNLPKIHNLLRLFYAQQTGLLERLFEILISEFFRDD